MASAHGAGVMVLPFVMPSPPVAAAGHQHVHAAASMGLVAGGIAVGVHTFACFDVMALMAWIVYRRLGLRLLRTAWLNLDGLWAGALVVTGVIVLFM
jgi:hypothetical protein